MWIRNKVMFINQSIKPVNTCCTDVIYSVKISLIDFDLANYNYASADIGHYWAYGEYILHGSHHTQVYHIDIDLA